MESKALPAVYKAGRTPYPAYLNSAITAAASLPALLSSPGFQRVYLVAPFSAIFYGAGYVSSTGDYKNGAGIATSWGLIYLFCNTKKAWLSRRPLALGSVAAVAVNTGIYAATYFADQ